MGMIKEARNCYRCKQRVSADVVATNHILHFLISFFTCGMWLLVWAIIAARHKPGICPRCGGRC